jgi:hypothetical protein
VLERDLFRIRHCQLAAGRCYRQTAEPKLAHRRRKMENALRTYGAREIVAVLPFRRLWTITDLKRHHRRTCELFGSERMRRPIKQLELCR